MGNHKHHINETTSGLEKNSRYGTKSSSHHYSIHSLFVVIKDSEMYENRSGAKNSIVMVQTRLDRQKPQLLKDRPFLRLLGRKMRL